MVVVAAAVLECLTNAVMRAGRMSTAKQDAVL